MNRPLVLSFFALLVLVGLLVIWWNHGLVRQRRCAGGDGWRRFLDTLRLLAHILFVRSHADR